MTKREETQKLLEELDCTIRQLTGAQPVASLLIGGAPGCCGAYYVAHQISQAREEASKQTDEAIRQALAKYSNSK